MFVMSINPPFRLGDAFFALGRLYVIIFVHLLVFRTAGYPHGPSCFRPHRERLNQTLLVLTQLQNVFSFSNYWMHLELPYPSSPLLLHAGYAVAAAYGTRLHPTAVLPRVPGSMRLDRPAPPRSARFSRSARVHLSR